MFLNISAKSLVVLAFAAPAASLLASCGQGPLDSASGTGGAGGGGTSGSGLSVPNNPTNEYTFGFTSYPQLQNPGGSVRVTINATSGAKDVYITRVATGTVDTVSTICTHQGCVINAYDSSTQQYLCPCHNSIFAADGSVLQGPANTPLPSYVSSVTATGITVMVV